MGKNRQRQRKSSQRPRPTATNTAMAGDTYTGLVGTVSLNASCVRQLFKRKQSRQKKKRGESNQESAGFDGMVSSLEAENMRTHARTHARTAQTNKGDPAQGEGPSVVCRPSPRGSTANFCRVTELGFTSRTGTHPSLGAECERG